jgi:hypothetical protein
MAEARTAADNAAKSIPAALQAQRNGEKYFPSCAEKLQEVFSLTQSLQYNQLHINFLTFSIQKIERERAWEIQECKACPAQWAGCRNVDELCHVCSMVKDHARPDYEGSVMLKSQKEDLIATRKQRTALEAEKIKAQKIADESRRLAEAVKNNVEAIKTIVEALKGKAERAKGTVEAKKTQVEAGKTALEGQKSIADGAEKDAEGHSDKTEEAAKGTYKAVSMSTECAEGLATVMPSTQQLFNLNSNPVCLVPPNICITSG